LPVHPDLQTCRELLAPVTTLPADLADAAVPGKWSIAAILEHLDLTYTMNGAAVTRRAAKGAGSPARARSFQHWLAQTIVITIGHFPAGRRSPEMVLPRGRLYADVAPALDVHLIELDRHMNDAARVLGERARVLDHPRLGQLSINDWRRFHAVHTRHHVRQIETLARRAGAGVGTAR
jgi:hypothetical protein